MTVLRCRAGARVGLGHLVRCRVLADILNQRGVRPVMVGPPLELKNEGDSTRFRDWIVRPEWRDANTEAKFHIDLCAHYSCKTIVLDDYRSDGPHQLALRDSGLICLQQYDASIAQNFAAQLVVNSSPYERRAFYDGNFLRPDVRTLFGPEYSILRPEFLKMTPRPTRNEVKQILVTFGGGDDRGAVEQVLIALSQRIPSTTKITVMAGASNPNLKYLQQLIDVKQMSGVDLVINPAAPHHIINNSDIAILSGGTTTFEAAFCGVPMILIPIADNQHGQGKGWDQLKAAKYLGPLESIDIELLRNMTNALIMDSELRQKMSNAGRKQVDGAGGQRLVDELIDFGG